jgi:hypothetical protein
MDYRDYCSTSIWLRVSVEKIKDDLVKQWEVSQPDAQLSLPYALAQHQ